MKYVALVGVVSASFLASRAGSNATQNDDSVSAPYGTLTAISPMKASRFSHTSTVLRDGRVLIVGGFTSQSTPAPAAELFDPQREQFSALPRTTPRLSHTATLLNDGSVLIVGGYAQGNEVTASVELLDPVTQTFRSIAPLNTPRAGHVAVRLSDGRVLIAGGVGPNWTFLASAELYDPATGRFSATGSMTVARESHAAVHLPDGRVFIVGGHRDRRDNIKLYTSAEAYNPATGTFSAVGDMHTRRHKHDALLLRDGRVFISGGSDERDNRGAYTSTEFFDPRTNTFAAGPAMNHARYKHNGATVLLPDGKVLLAGGHERSEVFDPSGNTFRDVASQTSLAGQFSAVAQLSGGTVLISGGYGSGPIPNGGAAAWMFRP